MIADASITPHILKPAEINVPTYSVERQYPIVVLPLMASGLLFVASAAATAAPPTPPTELHIPGERVVPESLTSSRDGTVYIGSVGTGAITRVLPGTDTAQPWVQPPTGSPQAVFGLFADDRSGTLWACSATLGKPPESHPGSPSELQAFDLKTGAPKGRYPLPTDGAFCNDIATGTDGTVYATDTNNMQILRLTRGATHLEVWSADGAFGPKGGAVDGIAVLNHTVYVNTFVTGKIFAVSIGSDGKAGATVELKLERTLSNPDGMRTFRDKSLLLVEGGGPGRLSNVTLTQGGGTLETLKEGYPDNPVAVTVIGGKTAYVLEAQWKAMRPDPNYKPKPFHATAVSLP
jgi:sugar lactone lactonase YvrE